MLLSDEEKYEKVREIENHAREHNITLAQALEKYGLAKSTFHKWRHQMETAQAAQNLKGRPRPPADEANGNGHHPESNGHAPDHAETAFLKGEVARLRKLIVDLITRNKTIEDLINERI